MHNHSDFKLMSRCITSLERANNIGLHPYAARAPLDGTTSLSPPPALALPAGSRLLPALWLVGL